jgi:hypothetical protein
MIAGIHKSRSWTASVLLPCLLVLCLGGSCRERNDDFRSAYRLHPSFVEKFTPGSTVPFWSIRFDKPESASERSFVHQGLQFTMSVEGDDWLVAVHNFDGEGVKQRTGFSLMLKNYNSYGGIILWSAAQYIDEDSRGHEVVHCLQSSPEGSLAAAVKSGPPTTFQEGGFVRELIFPAAKKHPSANRCINMFSGQPILPWTATDADAELERIAAAEIPVKLVIPIEISGERHDYHFGFVLRPREDRY